MSGVHPVLGWIQDFRNRDLRGGPLWGSLRASSLVKCLKFSVVQKWNFRHCLIIPCYHYINQQIVLRYLKFAKLSPSDALRIASFQPKVTTARRQFCLLHEIICCPLLEFSCPMILTMNKNFSGLDFLQAASVILRTGLSAKYESKQFSLATFRSSCWLFVY